MLVSGSEGRCKVETLCIASYYDRASDKKILVVGELV